MKVLQIINSHADTAGGAEKLATQLHRGFLEKGIDSHLLCLSKAPSNRRENLYSLGFSTAYHPAVFFRLLRFLRQARWRDVDIIHVHLFPAQLVFVLAARLLKLRAVFVTTEHNTFNRRRQIPGAKWIDRFYYRSFRKVVCISEGTRQTMAQWLPELEPKLLTILNGVDISKYSSERDENKDPQRPLVVISAGRLTKQKNHIAAIRAIKEVEHLNFQYWIAGRGELETQLKEEVKSLQLEDKIKFLGFRGDLPALLNQADVFLFTSLWEGFGLSVVEAMAAGLPVVVSDVPGVSEIVGRESNSGLFADPSSPKDIAARLEELLQSEELRTTMGHNGQRRAAFFDIRRMTDDYVRLYTEMQMP